MAVSIVMTGTARSCTLTSGSSSMVVSSNTGLVVGATIQGTGIPAGTRIASISGTTVTMENGSGAPVNATAGGAQNLIFSSVWGSVLTISMSASGDTANMDTIYNAGFGVKQRGLAAREIFFPGGLGVIWRDIVAGAVFDFQNWTIEFGSLGYWAWSQASIFGELRGGYLVNGAQFIKSSGPTFIANNFKNNAAGGSNMFIDAATGTVTGNFRMNNLRVVYQTGSNSAPFFACGRMNCIVDNMILDYQAGGGPNAGMSAAFGALNNTTIVRANSGIGNPNGGQYATINGLSYSGIYTDTPSHKFSIPNGYVLEGYAPQVLSTQLLGGFQDNTTETFANIDLSTAGWGLNDLKTKYVRYGGNNVIQFPRKVSFEFNDSNAANLTGVTLYIKSGSTDVVNAVQAGDYTANTQALVLNWTSIVASYRVCNNFVDTIEQVAQFRKTGYVSQGVSYSLNTASYSQPIFLLNDPAMGSVTPEEAALVTGVSPDYINKVLTGSASRNLDEVYAFGSHSQALTVNSSQPDYQTSDGGVYRLLTTWKLNWTSGALTMGEYNRTVRSSTQWKFGNTASLTFDKDDVLWTPAVRGDLFQFESGSALNIANGSTLTVSPTAGLGYGTATTSEFRANSTLNMSDSAVIYNIPSGGAGTVFSNSEANATWNISNSVLTLNCPNNAQVAVHAYFKPESVINGLTVNGTASNVVWQMGYTTNNSKMVGFKYGGAIFGNGTSNCLMDTYTYTGANATIPSNFGSSNKWYWVDAEMQAGGLFRWSAGGTPTGNAGFYAVLGFRPVIKTEKVGYAPKLRITPSAMATRYPAKTITTAAESTVGLSEFFRDPTFMPTTDGFLPFVDSLDDKTVINAINWTLDFRQNGWLGQSVTFAAAAAKKGLVTYSASGAVDSNYINDTTGAADAALITVNETTKILAAATGTLTWSAQRMYNALINKWSSFAIEQNIVAGSTGGKLDLADYTVDDSISFIRGSVTDLLSEVKTTGIIESVTNEVPVADVNGSRASISGTDPQNFGVTWFLRWKKESESTWTEASGTGNTTQIVVDQDTYSVQARVPGYDWKTVTFDTTLSLSLDLNLSYQVSANNTPQYTMTYDATLEAIFQYDATAMKVAVSNTTAGILQPGFSELYRATQRIQHIPALVWTWTAPVTANATSQKILIPSGNPISMYLTDESTNSVKITCPVIHADTGESADDRVRGNPSGFSIILGSPATAESAGLQAGIVAALGGPNYDSEVHSLALIRSVIDLIKTAVDSTKVTAEALPTLAAIEASDVLAKAEDLATASEIATAVEVAIINEDDGQAVLQAIADKIGNENVTATVIAQTVRTELATELGRIDATISSRSTLSAADIPEGLTAAEVWAAEERTLTETAGLTPEQQAELGEVVANTRATFAQVSELTA